jgi:hypothetical protein
MLSHIYRCKLSVVVVENSVRSRWDLGDRDKIADWFKSPRRVRFAENGIDIRVLSSAQPIGINVRIIEGIIQAAASLVGLWWRPPMGAPRLCATPYAPLLLRHGKRRYHRPDRRRRGAGGRRQHSGAVPRLPVPAVVLEIVIGAIIGPQRDAKNPRQGSSPGGPQIHHVIGPSVVPRIRLCVATLTLQGESSMTDREAARSRLRHLGRPSRAASLCLDVMSVVYRYGIHTF